MRESERKRLVEILREIRGDEIALMDEEAEILIEHLLNKGAFIPPVNVGDIVKKGDVYYKCYRTERHTECDKEPQMRFWAEPINNDDEDDIYFWDVEVKEGTVVLTSREDAEKALKGGGNK